MHSSAPRHPTRTRKSARDALPRALDHLNVVWKALTRQRLFHPRGLAGAASLVEPVLSGDQLTARVGALADIFDLFMRTADGRSPSDGSLNAFRGQVLNYLPSGPGQDTAHAAVGQLIDISRIRNGHLHTDATNWAQALQRLGIPSAEPPLQAMGPRPRRHRRGRLHAHRTAPAAHPVTGESFRIGRTVRQMPQGAPGRRPDGTAVSVRYDWQSSGGSNGRGTGSFRHRGGGGGRSIPTLA